MDSIITVFDNFFHTFPALWNLASQNLVLKLSLLFIVIGSGAVLFATFQSQSSGQRNPNPQNFGHVWLFGFLASLYSLVAEGYRLLPSPAADRVSQVVWVQRSLDPEFATGDVLLDKGDPLRGAFTALIVLFSRAIGLEGAFFVLSFLFSVFLFVALAFLYLSFSPADFTSATLFAFLAAFFTWGRFGYQIAAHAGNYQFDFIPRVVAVSMIALAIGLLNFDRTKYQIAGLCVATMAVLVQPPASIVAIGTFLAAKFLSSWFTDKVSKKTGSPAISLPGVRLAKILTWASSISALGVFVTASPFGLRFFPSEGNVFVHLLWLSSLICFLGSVIFVKFALRIPADHLRGLIKLILFSGISLLILIANFWNNLTASGPEAPFTFLEELEMYDVILGIRSSSNATLWVGEGLYSVWITAFLLGLGWLLMTFSRVWNQTTLVNSLWLIVYLCSVFLSSIITLIPGIGGGNVLWPISSSFIVVIAGMIIILKHDLLGNHRRFFFVIVATGLLVSGMPDLQASDRQDITLPGLLLILLVAGRLLARRIQQKRVA